MHQINSSIRSALSRHWILAWPLILANLATPLLALSDASIAGHLTDTKYLAAVTVGAELITFVFWIFGFLRMGTTGLISQAHGAKDEFKKKLILSNSLLIAFIISLIVVLFIFLIKENLIYSLIDDPSLNILVHNYVALRLISTPAVLMTYVIYGWLIGNQFTKFSVILIFITNGFNVILNIYLALFLELNSNGIALGTAIAEWLGFFIGLAFLNYLGDDRLTSKISMFHKKTLLSLANINVPLFIRTVVLKIVFLSLTIECAKLGINVAASIGVLLIILTSIAHCIDGFAFASEIEAGNSFGSRSYYRFKSSLWAGAIWALVSSLFFSFLLLFFGPMFISLLTPHEEVVFLCNELTPFFCLFLIILAPSYWLDGVFIGLMRVGDMCQTVVLAAVIGWFGGILLFGTSTPNDILFSFTGFCALRTILLLLKLKNAIQAFKNPTWD